MPYPPYRGDKLKIFNLALELSQNHELHLITIAENQEDIASVELLLNPTAHFLKSPQQRLFHSITWEYRPKWKSALSAAWGLLTHRPVQVAFFRSKRFAKRLDDLLKQHQFDAIHVQHLRMSQYFENGVPPNAILDLPDAFSLYWKRRMDAAKTPMDRWFRKLEFRRLLAYEKKMLPLFNRSLVCSSEDQNYLRDQGINNVEVLPNGVNISSFSPKGAESIVRNRILFTGNMDYAPNVDAVQYFVHDILPLVVEKHPQVQFIIAGQRPVKSVLDLASDRVKITGFIEDLSEEYAKAHVVVSPLRIGAGTQNKVLEALAMNQAVVCSKVGFEGLGIPNKQGILMGEDALSFANAVNAILDTEELQNQMGTMGGNHVRQTFAWNAIAQQLLYYFNNQKS